MHPDRTRFLRIDKQSIPDGTHREPVLLRITITTRWNLFEKDKYISEKTFFEYGDFK